MTEPFRKGMFVEVDGLLAVVTGLPGEEDVPEEHVALWFGEPRTERTSQGGAGGFAPELWIVPLDVVSVARPPVYKH